MAVGSESRGIRVADEGHSTHVLDVRCGRCAPCGGGLDYWCLEARDDGPRLISFDRPVPRDELRRWLSGLAALATTTAAAGSALLVLEDVDPASAAELVRPWHSGPVLTSSDGRDDETRNRLAEMSPTGRAPTVLTLRHARTAVRSVERGGQVCLPDLEVDAPTVTELVQRDVRLLAARQVTDLVATTSWQDLGRRLAQVLDTTRSGLQVGR